MRVDAINLKSRSVSGDTTPPDFNRGRNKLVLRTGPSRTTRIISKMEKNYENKTYMNDESGDRLTTEMSRILTIPAKETRITYHDPACLIKGILQNASWALKC